MRKNLLLLLATFICIPFINIAQVSVSMSPREGYQGDTLQVLLSGPDFFLQSSGTINKVWLNKSGGTSIPFQNFNPISKDSASATVYLSPNTLPGTWSVRGEDTLAQTFIRFFPSFTVKKVEIHCDQYTWPQNGTTYTNSGFYYDTLQSSQGMDSIIALNLRINPTPLSTIAQGVTTSICDGDSALLSLNNPSNFHEWYYFNDSVKIWSDLSKNTFKTYNQERLIFANGHDVYMVEQGGPLNVYKLVGSQWVYISEDLVGSTYSDMEFLNGEPYLAHRLNGRLAVSRYDGNTWIPVGIPGVGPSIHLLDLEIDNGELYVAYLNFGINSLSVKKFDGSNWNFVGNDTIAPNTRPIFLSFDVDNGTPYVAYNDRQTNGDKASVKRYDSLTGWTYVGPVSITSGRAYDVQFHIISGVPTLIYRDVDNGGTRVMEFKNNIWAPMPSIPLGLPGTSYLNTIVDENNYLYVPSLSINSWGNQFTVHQFDGSTWTNFTSDTIIGMSGNYRRHFLAVQNGNFFITYNIGQNNPLYPGVAVYSGLEFIDTTQSIYANKPGKYFVVATSSSSCFTTDTVLVGIGNSNTGTASVTACNSYTWIDGNTYTTSTNTPTFVMTNASGCDSTITLNLSLDTVNLNVSQNLGVLTSAQTGGTYQWIDCNNGNQGINGATNQSFTSAVPGSYAVIVNFNGCSDTSNCVIVTSLNEHILALDGLQSYPNPANDNLVVNLSEQTQLGDLLRIQSITGELLLELKMDKNSINLDMSGIPNGLYFISYQGKINKVIIAH